MSPKPNTPKELIYTESIVVVNALFKSSQEKYEELISEQPDIIRRVPLGIIASFLGMSQVNLSRIRAKIR